MTQQKKDINADKSVAACKHIGLILLSKWGSCESISLTLCSQRNFVKLRISFKLHICQFLLDILLLKNF